jgi:hypothetical protein
LDALYAQINETKKNKMNHDSDMNLAIDTVKQQLTAALSKYLLG